MASIALNSANEVAYVLANGTHSILLTAADGLENPSAVAIGRVGSDQRRHDAHTANAKDPHLSVGVFQEIPAATYSPKEEPLSTIGAGGLDCCVRNGNRYISTAITTGNHVRSAAVAARTGVSRLPERPRTSTNIKFQALGRLVPVS